MDVEGGTVNSSGGYCINGTNCISSWPTAGSNTWSSSQTFSANTVFPGSGIWNTSGHVGIGTTAPSGELSVTPGQYAAGTASQSTNTVTGSGTTFTSAMIGSQLVFANGVSAGTITALTNATHVTVSTSQTVTSQAYAISYTGLQVASNGNVGIGTTAPGTALEVNGNMKMTYNPSSPTSFTFSDGTVQTTAYTGVTCGGDYAESVDVTGNRTNYEPGDVLVLDADNPGRMLKSIEAYSTSVSGIYSTKPGTVGRRQTTEKSPDEVPMAIVGIVPAKVSAENGSIKIGDLLVTSSTPGYAMKGTDRSRMLGASTFLRSRWCRKYAGSWVRCRARCLASSSTCITSCLYRPVVHSAFFEHPRHFASVDLYKWLLLTAALIPMYFNSLPSGHS